MGDMASTAEALRRVRRAFEHFLTLWAVDSMLENRSSRERLHADLERIGGEASSCERIGLSGRGVMDD